MKVSCLSCGKEFERGEAPAACPGCGEATRLLAFDSSEHAIQAQAATVRMEGPPPPLEPAGRDLKRIGPYDILERAGAGGMGVVYKARDTRLNRIVALKVIVAGEHASPETIARFQREARSAARLNHPNIVHVYDVGSEGGALHYFAMEYVEGRSLDVALRDPGLKPEDAAKLTRDLAKALHYAHLQGIIHRDIKPANVMLDARGFPRLTDFGLAKSSMEEATLTQTHQVMGTACYMPPEQAGGMAEVDQRSDVYSLGAVLYEVLSRRKPFDGATLAAVLRDVEEKEPAPPSQSGFPVPRDLETICLTAMAKEKSRRYASADLMAADLDRFLAGEPVAARRLSLAARFSRWAARHPSAFAAGLLAILLAGVLAWQSFRPAAPAPPGPPPPDRLALLNQARPFYAQARADYDLAARLKNPDDRPRRQQLFRTAASSLDEALAAFPDFAEACLLRALVHLELNHPAQALADLDRTLALDPRLADAYYVRARLRLKRIAHQVDTSAGMMEKEDVLVVAADDLTALRADVASLEKTRMRPEIALVAQAAVLFEIEDQHDAARHKVEEALKLNPTLADALVLRAHMKQSAEDSAAAEADLDAAIGYDPNHRDAFMLRAELRFRSNRKKEALADLDELVAIAPDEPNSYIQRAFALSMASASEPHVLHERVEADIRKALELDPNSGEAWGLRGSLRFFDLISTGLKTDLKLIRSDFDEALRLSPWLISAHSLRLVCDVCLDDEPSYSEHFALFRKTFPTLKPDRFEKLNSDFRMMAASIRIALNQAPTMRLSLRIDTLKGHGDKDGIERLLREMLARVGDPKLMQEEKINVELAALLRRKSLWDLAKIIALKEDKAEAFGILEELLAGGVVDEDWRSTKDLESLHADERWKKLEEKYGRKR